MKAALIQGNRSGTTVSLPTARPARAGLLQRQCDCGQHTIAGGQCEECRRGGKTTLRRAAVVSTPGGIAPPLAHEVVPSLVHDVLDSSGQPIEPSARTFMESRFGHDFSRVRVHTDSRPGGLPETPAPRRSRI